MVLFRASFALSSLHCIAPSRAYMHFGGDDQRVHMHFGGYDQRVVRWQLLEKCGSVRVSTRVINTCMVSRMRALVDQPICVDMCRGVPKDLFRHRVDSRTLACALPNADFRLHTVVRDTNIQALYWYSPSSVELGFRKRCEYSSSDDM